jgi:hypothetical protein
MTACVLRLSDLNESRLLERLYVCADASSISWFFILKIWAGTVRSRSGNLQNRSGTDIAGMGICKNGTVGRVEEPKGGEDPIHQVPDRALSHDLS